MFGRYMLTLALLFTAGLLRAQPAVPTEPAIVAEAKAFMAAYGDELRAGDRPAIAGRYSRTGAYALGWSAKRFDDHATIAGNYAGSGWQKPYSFSWLNLSYEPLGPDAVVVVGGFAWGKDDKSAPISAAYTALLRRESGGLRIRVEHENLVAKPPASR